MADQSGSGLTQIIVAIIGVVGVVSGALFANWDKIFPHERAPRPSNTVIAPRPDEVRPAPSLPQPQAGGPPVATPVPPAIVDISGSWHDNDGFVYVVRQQGRTFDYAQQQGGRNLGSGDGTIIGHALHYNFTGGGNNGNCTATIAADTRSFSGTCTDGTASWPFRVDR